MFITTFKLMNLNELCDEFTLKKILLEMFLIDNLVNP